MHRVLCAELRRSQIEIAHVPTSPSRFPHLLRSSSFYSAHIHPPARSRSSPLRPEKHCITNIVLYYNRNMKTATVQARLDLNAQRSLARLVRRLGWTPSKVVREGLRLLSAATPAKGRPRVAGLGKFSSG